MPGNGINLAYIEAPAGEQPIKLCKLEVEAVISGLYAETRQTMVFFNPNSRPLEGNLTFPMPEGAVVCGYALDVEGRMVDGVVVARQEARRILEAEIRKGVDPGLLEQVAGNLYRTRIYPLPARGTRCVHITYVNELTSDGCSAHYHLPVPRAACLERVAVRLEVRHSPVVPALTGMPEIVLRAHEGCWVAEGDVPADVPHDFHLVLPELPERFSMVERTSEGEVFFCVSAAQPPNEGEIWRPRRLAVAWDASGSRMDCQAEFELLGRLAEQWSNVPVDLVVVRQSLDPPQTFADLASLLTFLQDLPADGATGLSQLDFSQPPHPECDAWLLCSDGLDTVDPGLPTLGSLPIFAITSQVSNNSAWLGYLAEHSQGAFINLTRVQGPQATEMLTSRSGLQLPIHCQGGSQVHLARSPGRIQALGRLTPVEPWALVSTGPLEALRVEAREARNGRLLARAWAGRELGALQARGQDDRAALELGQRYGLVTPGASLLVLENLQQYLEYNVCPPVSLPEMRQAFLDHRDRDDLARESLRRDHLEVVSGLWDARVKWWEQDFRSGWDKFAPKPEPARMAAQPDVESLELALGMANCDDEGAFRSEPVLDAFCCEPMMMEMEMESCAQAPGAPAMMAAPAPTPPPQARGGGGSPHMEPPTSATIAIRAWDPETPYLRAMEEAGPERAYEAYLRLRPEYAASPSFFLDCADRLLSHGDSLHGLRVLSNLLEMGLDDPPLMRMYAWRLQQAGQLDGAVQVLERVLQLRSDEPQSYRDLGLALGDRWEATQNPADAYRAAELLYEVIHRDWERFPEIELIALMELNRLLARAERAAVPMPSIDPRLHRLLDLDLRISMSWDADLTDVDLHLHEPTGEHAYYGHNQTVIGGLVSRDFRQGYGPEEYVLRRAYPGPYDIRAHYFGSHQQTLTGSCTVLVRVFTNFGRVDEERRLLTLRLDRPSSEESVGVVTIQGERQRV
ncbi:DUF2135 domain-containing protein [bacterium]|nr:DUF2135 domain-containing protein [bacterium]